MDEVESKASEARIAYYVLANLSTESKNKALDKIAEAIWAKRDSLLASNRRDVEESRRLLARGDISEAILKRLQLDEGKVGGMVEMVKSVARLEDPIGKTTYAVELDDDLELYRVTTPIGVISFIFESRPDALSQIASLCLKSGNSVLLKGGSETKHSNKTLYEIIRDADTSLPAGWIQLVETREDVRSLLSHDDLIDLVIPRGSNSFVKYIQSNTSIPVLGHSEGVCHIYVDDLADLDMAVRVCFDSKVQYPSVCNAVDLILIHKDVAGSFLPALVERMETRNVEMRGDSLVCDVMGDRVKALADTDLGAEYLDYIVGLKVVDSLDEAVSYINRYGSHHTDAIITENPEAAAMFMDYVDSASVFWNASTRFADGYRYGLGSEVGISTGKIHARGPTGLEGLTSYKYYLKGSGNTVDEYIGDNKREFKHQPLGKAWMNKKHRRI